MSILIDLPPTETLIVRASAVVAPNAADDSVGRWQFA